jgi:4'-phosphopantetheinyl transferase
MSRCGVFDINISHQGDFCVLAGDSRPKVGIDVMRLEYSGGRSLEDFFDLMKRQFSRTEWTFIRTSGGEDRDKLRRFMRLWCLKESYVKAEGVGIGFDLQRISFDCPTTPLTVGTMVCDSRVSVDGQCLKEWRFEETLLDQDHCVAIAFQTDPQSEVVITPKPLQEISFEELMAGAVPMNPEEGTQSWDCYSKKDESPRLCNK